jgi:beta-glucosidase/6-phospho-beta-glucosidase/beta-galactosidase
MRAAASIVTNGSVHEPPTQFLWGVATSPYQVEGGFNGVAEPQNHWAWSEAAGHVERTGPGVRFLQFASSDFQRCARLGMNAFRFGMDWSRVQPVTELPGRLSQGTVRPPPFDETALDRYARLVDECRQAGLEPILTLHHFVHPAWLGVDAWLRPETISHFEKYVRRSVGHLLRKCRTEPPKWFTTVNEPAMMGVCTYLARVFPTTQNPSFRLAGKAVAALLLAHARAYRIIHELYAEAGFQRPVVTFNTFASDLYWIDGALADVFLAPARRIPRAGLMAHLRKRARQFESEVQEANLLPRIGRRAVLGWLLKRLHHALAPYVTADPCWEALVDEIYGHEGLLLDAVAFDYYDPFAAHLLRWPRRDDFDAHPRSVRDVVVESVFAKWWEWKHVPRGLGVFVRRHRDLRLPVLIAENGMAERAACDGRRAPRSDGLKRADFVRDMTREVNALVEEGEPLAGYLHWSLVDNYEWGTYGPRFGLLPVEVANGAERPLTSAAAEAFAAEIARARIIS